MGPTHTFEQIQSVLHDKYARCDRQHIYRLPAVGSRVGFMVPTIGFDDVQDRITKIGIAAILFARPDVPLAKEQVIPQLSYFHYRSGDNVDFFCVGYASQDEAGELIAPRQIGDVDGVRWVYSDQAFERLCQSIETRSRWRYSGDTDLVLIRCDGNLQFNSAIVINLESAITDETVPSVANLFEKIILFCRKYNGHDPIFDLSDHLGLRIVGKTLFELLLPERLYKFFNRSKHLAIRDISRR